MSTPGSLTWFAAHETRLAWRELLAMLSGGKPERLRGVAFGVLVFALILHGVAYLVLGRVADVPLERDLATLVVVTAGVTLSGSAILSQAMESVTRTFYTRSDLELILSSPAPVPRLFAVRIGAIALSVSAMSFLLMGPFIDVLVWQGGLRWLGAYGVILAIALIATALAVVLTVALFQAIGPKRTRMAAQVAAAVIGAVFVIGLQVAAMFSTGTMSRLAFLRSDYVIAHAPGVDSALWWPARAALGDVPLMLTVVGLSFVVFVATTLVYAPRFAGFAVAASSVSHAGARFSDATRAFRVEAAPVALRRKERLLLIRDPWLLSQSLMQVLYLLPPALLLWHNYGDGEAVAVVLVPVLVMAAGQLAGGLAWLTISGEDAPDLVLTAPVPEAQLLRAKVAAVMQCIAVVFSPFALALILYAPSVAPVVAVGIAASAASATAIQFWFRSQAKRSLFRRRHTSSRIATFAEAFASIIWAGAAGLTAAGRPVAVVVALMGIALLAGVRALSPARARR